MQWMIGIDGGGTKTVGCAADCTGKIIGRVEKGPSNYHTVGLNDFQAVIRTVIEALASRNGLCIDDLLVVSLGLAGADRLADKKIIMGSLAQLGLPCQYLVDSDAKAALAAGIDRAEGIVLIAGTGSVAYGINQQGDRIRAGGWGHRISDEGSGYDIGRQALVRGMKAAEQRDQSTVLLPAIMECLQLQSWDQLIGWINSQATTKAEVAALAQVVIMTAQTGDQVAREIVQQAARDLAGLAESVITRGFLAGEKVSVCLYGGILTHSDMIRNEIEKMLADKANLVIVTKEPAEGAVRMALDWLQAKEQETCRSI